MLARTGREPLGVDDSILVHANAPASYPSSAGDHA